MARRKQSGVALITALLVVAIASIAAAQMLSSQHLDIRRTDNILSRDQAWFYALSAEQVAINLLAEDRAKSNYDGLDEAWAQTLPPVAVGPASIVLKIEDLQGRFNVNNLATDNKEQEKAAQDQLRRLLQMANPSYHTGVEVAVADWVDSDVQPRFPDGAEDDIYTRKDPPYRPADRPMLSPGELRIVNGMDDKTFEGLRPMVTALPDTDVPLNVNTASPAVLRSLADKISERDAEEAAKGLAQKPVKDIKTFMNQYPAFADPSIVPERLATDSQYFLVHGHVALDRARMDIYSVIHRPDSGAITVIYRSQSPP